VRTAAPGTARGRGFPDGAGKSLGAGLLTSEQLRSPAWRRLFRGVYADAESLSTTLSAASVRTCSSRRLRADRRRLNRLTAAGWTVLHVTADRLRHDVDRPVRELATVAGW
jgi:hypothetical protein